MKPFLSLLLCLWASLAHAQNAGLPTDPETHLVTYTAVVAVPGVSQPELYARAKLWFASSFTSAKSVVQADEKDAGVIQGTGWAPISVHLMGPKRLASDMQLWFTLRVSAKEGRYRYEFTSLETGTAPSVNFPTPTPNHPLEPTLAQWKAAGPKYGSAASEFEEQVASTMQNLESVLKAGMAKSAAGTSAGKADW